MLLLGLDKIRWSLITQPGPLLPVKLSKICPPAADNCYLNIKTKPADGLYIFNFEQLFAFWLLHPPDDGFGWLNFRLCVALASADAAAPAGTIIRVSAVMQCFQMWNKMEKRNPY